MRTAGPEIITSREAIYTEVLTPETKVGEVKIVVSGSAQDPARGPEPTELSLAAEKIKTKVDNKLALDKLREIRK